jgi:hypothetical protein
MDHLENVVHQDLQAETEAKETPAGVETRELAVPQVTPDHPELLVQLELKESLVDLYLDVMELLV